jgi:polygalacturonase
MAQIKLTLTAGDGSSIDKPARDDRPRIQTAIDALASQGGA